MISAEHTCPCGSDETYTSCCRILHLGRAAQTAEQLMRSRYSAYALKLIDYLVETTHPDQRVPDLKKTIAEWADQAEFYRLEIISTRQGQVSDKIGKVEFIAHYRQGGKERQLCELSRFKRYAKHWVYLDGEIGP